MNQSILISASGTALLAAMLAGCADKEPCPCLWDAEEEPCIAITLHIPTENGMGATRAYPSGGEDGDGREQGLTAENELADANIFFFQGSGFNPDTDPSAIEVTGVYVADLSAFTAESEENPFEKKVTVKVPTAETRLEEKGILTAPYVGFITVLNAGHDLSPEIANLKALREYSSFTSSWSLTEEGYHDFLMTTAYDAESDGCVSIDGNKRFVGSNRLEKSKKDADDPTVMWTGETTVQRVCARVDLMCLAANIGDGELVYVTEREDKVHITNILPVNFMQQPSYLLTKTTADIPTEWSETALSAVTWGGTENTDANSDLPSNYVIEPTTFAKASGTKDFSNWYGTSAASVVKNQIADADKGKCSGYPTTDIPAAENRGNDKALIIGYPNENIQAPSCYTSDFITGLAIRASFQPHKIWRKSGDDYVEVELTDDDWRGNKTVWRYQPSAGVDGVNPSDAYYFITEADVEAYRDSHPSDLATVTKYDNGVCYYNLWLRHYNDETYKEGNTDPKEIYPMEFAIVRNNIYRVAVSFSGPGDPTPTLREPDTMMSRIFVRKWNKRVENSPLQF